MDKSTTTDYAARARDAAIVALREPKFIGREDVVALDLALRHARAEGALGKAQEIAVKRDYANWTYTIVREAQAELHKIEGEIDAYS
jgi:hypothetical protein